MPESFTIHRKLRKPLSKRIPALEEGGIEFGHAEALAFSTLLTEGVHIRLTGQDTERGTFSNRHLVLHDENTGLKYCPMQNLDEAKAPFELYNSPLSEIACLGFEYGYSATNPNALVIWEAQYGDFANAGQVIIDSFIVSGEAKWGQTSRLTLLLPHGYEGSGPEHSSARIERFLALAAEGNIRIANPSTAAQYFHLLRRQALIRKPRPLIVFSPKGLLRLDRAAATPEQLTDGHFELILDDPKATDRRDKVERLILCSGKIYHDLDASERRDAAEDVAIARVELLYPFAKEQLEGLIDSYPNLKEVVWTQEEPRNMGASKVMSRRLPELLPEGVELGYVGRPTRASPGEGYAAAHAREQERIVLTALTAEADAQAGARPPLPLGEAIQLGRAGDLLGPDRVLDRARVRNRDDGVRVGARPRLHRTLCRDLDRRGEARGPVHTPRGHPHTGRPGRKRDRNRADRAPRLGCRRVSTGAANSP